ncbi:MAG: hypothetical protein DHS20C14_03320 [Phycisphaeraceae bacterium]|nr:MAG: hypothetical protein DHS20C14_03320 [Phycisphaeraceae bacterium]
MFKLIKWLVVIVILIVLLVVGLVVFGISQIDGLVKAAIEKGGTYATGVETTVDTVDVSLRGGTFAMDGFNLANPDGYDSPHFLHMGGTNVAVSTASLGQDVISVPEVTLAGIDLYLDKSGGNGNYNFVLEKLKRFESSGSDSAPANEGGKKVVIDKLVIDGVTTHVTGVPGLSSLTGDVKVNVPRIELLNVGAEDGGMTTAELINLVVKTVIAASVEAGGGIIPADMLTDMQGKLSQLVSLDALGITSIGELGDLNALGGKVGEAAKEKLDEAVGGAQEKAQDALDDAAKKAEDKLKGLFGGGDDEDDGP